MTSDPKPADVVSFGMMVILFRSVFLGILSLVPNVFPQAVTASMMVWLNEPLTVSGVLTFSICLGLSVDDTVHYLMRFTEERRSGNIRDAVIRTFQAVGGTMIMTSLILVGGFASMIVSDMPSIRLFAILSCATLFAAILGDLVMLPSLLLSFPKIAAKHGKRPEAESIDAADKQERSKSGQPSTVSS